MRPELLPERPMLLRHSQNLSLVQSLPTVRFAEIRCVACTKSGRPLPSALERARKGAGNPSCPRRDELASRPVSYSSKMSRWLWPEALAVSVLPSSAAIRSHEGSGRNRRRPFECFRAGLHRLPCRRYWSALRLGPRKLELGAAEGCVRHSRC